MPDDQKTTRTLPLCKWSTPPDMREPPTFASGRGFDAASWPIVLSRIPEPPESLEDLDRFLSPQLSSLSHPFSFPNVKTAASRISEAIDAGRKITVFGDFDADGVTASAILASTIKSEGGDVSVFIPLRAEGYGLTDAAVERCIRECAPSLVVTVDCGVTARDAILRFSSLGIETIVTDHHLPGDAVLPEGTVVCAPHLDGTPEALRFICGAGVAFELAAGLVVLRHPQRDAAGDAARRRVLSRLDALAVATIADVVPLCGENRLFAALGLRALNTRPGTGLRQLSLATLDSSCSEIDTRQVAFILAPHINSAGRMASARTAFELLVEEDPDKARFLAAKLKQTNALRKSECAKVDGAISRAIEEGAGFDQAKDGAVVMAGDGWAAGVIGLAAAHLCERFCRPAVVVSFDENGIGRGSARAPAGYDIHAALSSCAESLISFGGHESAAGLSVSRDQFEQFRSAFAAACFSQVGATSVSLPLQIDAFLDIPQITAGLAAAIASLAPFGAGNPEPVLAVRNVKVSASFLGRDTAKGLRLVLSDDAGAALEGLWFGAADLAPAFSHPARWDVAGVLLRDDFAGTSSVKLKVIDARPAAPPDSV